MDASLRDIERRFLATGDPVLEERLRRERQRCALFIAGTIVRLDGALVDRFDLTGVWRIAVARATATARTLVLHPLTHERASLYPFVDVVIVEEGLVSAALVAGDAVVLSRAPSLAVRCPHCGAIPGLACRAPDETPARKTHEARRGILPALTPLPPAPEVRLVSSRPWATAELPINVLESRNASADIRIRPEDLTGGSVTSILDVPTGQERTT